MPTETEIPQPNRIPPDESMAFLKTLFQSIGSLLFVIFVVLAIVCGTVFPQFEALWSILANISPFAWGGLGTGATIGLSILGAAWGILTTGSSIAGAAIRAPQIRSKNLISIIFCEAVAIYGIIMAIIQTGKMEDSAKSRGPTGAYKPGVYGSAYMIFCSGVTVGLGNAACGLAVGVVGSSCAIGDAANSNLFVKVLVIEIFASALGIFAIIVGILQTQHTGTW